MVAGLLHTHIASGVPDTFNDRLKVRRSQIENRIIQAISQIARKVDQDERDNHAIRSYFERAERCRCTSCRDIR